MKKRGGKMKDKRVIFKSGEEGEKAFVLADKNLEEYNEMTQVDLLTEHRGGNMLGRNMLLGSILNHMPYIEYVGDVKESKEDRRKVEELMKNVVNEVDYAEQRAKRDDFIKGQ
jgi:hypothetical protein